MRTIFLSFSPEWYPYIESGEKIYEHRKRFCKEPVIAYLYLGLPVQKIVAILELGKRINIESWLDKYRDDEEAIVRITESLRKNRFAMEIKTIQFIEPIPIDCVINEFPNFHIPQSYFYLDNKPELLSFINERVVSRGNKICNSFDNIKSDEICRY